MKIISANKLTEEQIETIKMLEQIVFQADGLENHVFLSNEINFDKNLPCFYLGYEEGTLVACLTAFMPAFGEAEILGFTHPQYRNKGFFNSLFQAARETLQCAGIASVLFAVEPKSKDGVAALQGYQYAVLERSEYQMSHQRDERPPFHSDLQFIRVDESNGSDYATIMQAVFEDEEQNESYISSLIGSKTRTGYLVIEGETPVGIFNIKLEEDAFIYGLGVLPAHRKKGIGRQMVEFCLNEGHKSRERMALDVDSDNPAAFHLYQACGFQIDFQVDYYRYVW